MIARPFLKWAGGKAKLAPRVATLLPRECEVYYEPFVGAGAVFWHLAQDPEFRCKHWILSDSNLDLVNTWQMVKIRLEAVLWELEQFDASESCYYRVRDNVPYTAIAQAARFIYLNKVGFNGLCRYNAIGEFNVPWCKDPSRKFIDSKNLTACSELLRKLDVQIWCRDWWDAKELTDARAVTYFDPPYLKLNKGSFTEYNPKGFSAQYHRRLAEYLPLMKGRWVLSNADTPLTRELYAQWNSEEVQGARAISCKANRPKVGELLVHNTQ